MHYGKYIESDTPITGVVLSNNPEFLYEDAFEGIELDFELHLLKCKNEYHDECYQNDEETYLIGFKKVESKNENKPMFVINQEAEYSAIVEPTYTQIVRSKWVSRTTLCSPCFPGQGDLDTEGNFLAFTLPPDIFGSAEHLPIIEYAEKD